MAIWDSGLADAEDSRSGWACGATREEAARRSYEELIERDAFLMSLLSPCLRTYALPPDGDFRLAKLQSMDPGLTVCCAGFRLKNDGPWLLGLGCAPTQEPARRKALLECLLLRRSWAPVGSGADDAAAPGAHYRRHWESGASPEVSGRV